MDGYNGIFYRLVNQAGNYYPMGRSVPRRDFRTNGCRPDAGCSRGEFPARECAKPVSWSDKTAQGSCSSTFNKRGKKPCFIDTARTNIAYR